MPKSTTLNTHVQLPILINVDKFVKDYLVNLQKALSRLLFSNSHIIAAQSPVFCISLQVLPARTSYGSHTPPCDTSEYLQKVVIHHTILLTFLTTRGKKSPNFPTNQKNNTFTKVNQNQDQE